MFIQQNSYEFWAFQTVFLSGTLKIWGILLNPELGSDRGAIYNASKILPTL